jgi:hypothetical protein
MKRSTAMRSDERLDSYFNEILMVLIQAQRAPDLYRKKL